MAARKKAVVATAKVEPTANTFGDIPILSADRTICSIANVELKVGSSLDFKSAIEAKVCLGKIHEFKYAGHREEDTESVWMFLSDVESGDMEWISVYVWNSQREEGIFGKVEKPKTNASSQPENTADYPF